MTGVGKLLWHLLDCNVQVLGHLVTYSILAYLIAALVVYFRLLPSARDRKDQLVSGSPVKQKSNNVPAGSFPALLGHALAHLHPQKVSHLVVPQVDKTFLKLFTFNYRVSQKKRTFKTSWIRSLWGCLLAGWWLWKCVFSGTPCKSTIAIQESC